MQFIAFDLETTGFVTGVDQIVEIGAVRFIDGQPAAVFSTLVDPRMKMPSAASAVNKITDDMLTSKPFIEDLLEPFAEFCGNDPLVAHNAPFDAQFILADYRKHSTTAPGGIVLDTLSISRKVFPGLANYKLATLIQHLKIPTGEDFHRAEFDATLAGLLFLEITRRVQVGGQAPALSNLVALTGKPEHRFPYIERKPKQLGFSI